jgi:hypothetical protein
MATEKVWCHDPYCMSDEGHDGEHVYDLPPEPTADDIALDNYFMEGHF